MTSVSIEGFRLSPQQKRLWVLQRGGADYCSQCALAIEGELNIETLKSVLRRLANQNEILRTTFHRRPGMRVPIQVVADAGEASWSAIDLRTTGPEDRDRRVDEILMEQGRLAFDFENGPVFRVHLVRLSAQKYILVVTLPSLCADTLTLRILTQGIARLYLQSPGDADSTYEIVQYAQFSEYQNEVLEDEDSEAGKEFWRRQELDLIPAITLPFETKTADSTGRELDSVEIELEADLKTKIDNLAKANGTSSNVVLLSGWLALLWKLTAQPDVVVANVFDGRMYDGLKGTLGLLAKAVPVKSHFESYYRFTEIIREAHASMRDAEERQEYFIREDGLVSDSSAVELSIGFEYSELPSINRGARLSIAAYKIRSVIDRFKLKLNCLEREGSLVAEFCFDTERYAWDDVDRLASQYRTLLESICASPSCELADLEFMSRAETERILVHFNDTKREYANDKTIHRLFEDQVERTPDYMSLAFEGQQITYRELNARANQLAHYLQNLGVGPEVVVAICLERSIEMFVSLVGILKAGGAYVPLDPQLPKERLALMLDDTQSPVVLTQQSLLEALPQSAARTVCVDRDWGEIANESAANTDSGATPENLVYVLFTSGSAGLPKAVSIEHRQLSNYLNAIIERLDLTAGMSFATVSTIAADLGNTVIYPSLCTGGCLHVISQERASDPSRLSQYFSNHAIDVLKIVPSHLAAALTCGHPEQVLPRRRLILGGEAPSWELINRVAKLAPDCVVFNHYGPTETTVGVLTHCVTVSESSKLSTGVPVGNPIANTGIYLLDSNSRPVAIGLAGELHVAGAGLARGYLNRPEATAERFVPFSFSSEPGKRVYKTGDLARWLSNGAIEFLGRIDHQVKIRGFRVEPGEIEVVLEQHASVRKAVVVAREDIPGDRRLVAYVVPGTKNARAVATAGGTETTPALSNQSVSVSELRTFLLNKLPDHMIPTAFVILDDLPLTSNGKIDRRALPPPGQTRAELEQEYLAPRNAVEEVVAGIWSQVIRVERVGIYDNFFELGGHSLLATQVVAWVREEFQIELPLRIMFEGATVAHMSEAIVAEEPVSGQAEKIAKVLLKVAAMPDEDETQAGS